MSDALHGSGPRGGRPRLVFDRERACQMHDLGFSMRDIARELGVSTMTIQRLLSTYVSPLPLLSGVPGLAADDRSQDSNYPSPKNQPHSSSVPIGTDEHPSQDSNPGPATQPAQPEGQP